MHLSISRKRNLLLPVLLFLAFFSHGQAPQPLSLTGEWEFRKAGDSAWLRATVPGTVHTDLLNAKKIGDPFYRSNEKELQWIGREDWEYRTAFDVDADLLRSDRLYLAFDGLDTYADVYVNEEKVLVADNMFRRWRVDLKSRVKNGKNELRVYFHSPIKTGEALYNSLPFRVPVSDNDQASPKVSVFTRKAGYHYGWDWGPRFVTTGIWRPVRLEAMNGAGITDLFIKQKQLTDDRADLEAQLRVESVEKGIKLLEVYADSDPTALYSKIVHLDKGRNDLVCSFGVPHPQRWWPNGYGAQRLYNFRVVLKDGQKVIAEQQVRHGMRTVEVIRESGDKGNSFYFLVNGVKIFMKGANYIPQDNFLPRVSKERYEHLINTAVMSNMNMLRVWGGGIYENDLFYDLCDEKGILIWQDFMFACAMQPPFEAHKQNIYEEAVDNIKRLRNHPSLAIWVGGNEIASFMGSDYWGTAKGAFRNAQDSLSLIDTYKDIFHTILPAAVKEYDNDRFYWSASPQANNYSLYSYDSRTSGDVHYWDVWGNNKPMEAYLDNIGPFMSEYGFQSFPDLFTIGTFALPEDLDIYSTVMKSHQRAGNGSAPILEYMKRWYKTPHSFADLLYVGQVLQGEGVRIAIEGHRRAKPFCMGSLYWQIDDCWPAASWSSMDYYGHWKALQYEAKRAFAPLLVSPVIRQDSVQVYIVSDSLKAVDAQLNIRLMDLDGRVLNEKNLDAGIAANSSGNFYTIALIDLLKGADRKKVLLDARLVKEGRVLGQSYLYFAAPKDIDLQNALLTHVLFRDGAEHYTLKLTTTTLVRNLRISIGDEAIIFSDNYFDLMPHETKIISFRSKKSVNANELSFMSVKDTDR